MKKKLFCLLAVLILNLQCSACAEKHILLTGTLNSAPDVSLTAELYENQDELLVFSSLFPAAYISMAKQEKNLSGSDLLCLRPDRAAAAMRAFWSELLSWSTAQNVKKKSGFFTGDLFDFASTMEETEFGAGEIMLFLRELCEKATDHPGDSILSDPIMAVILKRFASSVLPDLYGAGIRCKVRSFDSGKYAVMQFFNAEGILFTLSADYSGKEENRFLISHTENGRYFFRIISLSNQAKETKVSVELYSSTEESFRSAQTGYPILTEQLNWSRREEDTCVFEYSLHSPSLEAPLMLAGSAAFDQNGCIVASKADLYIQGGEEKFRITLSADNENAAPRMDEERTRIDWQRADQRGELTLTLLANLTQFATRILPLLPETYQKMIITLFFG